MMLGVHKNVITRHRIIVASVIYLSWLNHISASDEINFHSRHNRDEIEESENSVSPSKHSYIRPYNENTKNKESRNGLTGRILKSKGEKKASLKTKGKKKGDHAKKKENGSNGGYGNSAEINTIIPSKLPYENENDKKKDWGYDKENKNSSSSNAPTISPLFDNEIEKNDNEKYGSSKNNNNDVPTTSPSKYDNENNNVGYGDGNADGSTDVTGNGKSEVRENGSSSYDGYEAEEAVIGSDNINNSLNESSIKTTSGSDNSAKNNTHVDDKEESYQGNNIYGEQENSNTNGQDLSIRASSAIYFVITASIVAFVLAIVIGAIRSVLTPEGHSREKEKSLLKLASGNDDNRAHCLSSKSSRDKEIQTDFVRV